MTAPTAEDQLAIERLVASYCDGVIRRDTDTWAATWAVEGASWDLPGRSMEGKDAIVAFWVEAMKRFDFVMQTAPVTLVEMVDDDHAAGRSYVQEHFRVNGEVGKLYACYHDRYVRTPDGWRFQERRLEIIDRGTA
jgi:hypothetical protein